ncbi:Flagellar motor switch protein FliN [Roseivivax sp. THAF40]|uniref:FliM/FliN family flagellar motor switch protein n=1 Tax=Roseivivax sp. THAF40 TaxID=2587858 RepID=UPI0012A9BBED|nr:FliM/FliN family flagellar motor switch protein [Roseivivax sp. THAF40]QFT47380.1 Flagellar motor switch protein FliN [Roseivivax sp. THAF40]
MHDDSKEPSPSPEQTADAGSVATKEFQTDSTEETSAVMSELETSDDSAAYTGDSESKALRGHSIEALLNVDLDVSVVLGHSKMPISNLLKLSRGSVIELQQRIGEPVRIVVNSKTVARGELVKIAGERLGVSLTEIVREHIGND